MVQNHSNKRIFRHIGDLLFCYYVLFIYTYVMSSVLKLMMVEMKLSLIKIPLSCFQSSSPSPSNTAIDSMASITAGGGRAKVRTSTKCCFLMELTAEWIEHTHKGREHNQIRLRIFFFFLTCIKMFGTTLL